LQIHFCGVRGSTPAPGIDFVRYGGHTSCVAVAHGSAPAPTLILDAGAGLQTVSSLLGGAPFSGTILLTHVHWDHTLGLPFFPAGDRADARVTVLVPEQESGAEAGAVLARIMSPPYFPIEPTDLQGEWTFASIGPGARRIEEFDVLVREIPHKGGRTFGYRLSDGRSTLAYLPDHCPTRLGPGPDGFGEYHAAALELAQGVDVLVHDAQLFPEELASEADWGHAVADYAVELARRAETRSVVLFHHRPDRTDEALDGLALRFKDASPSVTVAAEGQLVDL
jgi:phosphoribosyl 1,2-cyclic phosphodiesterase